MRDEFDYLVKGAGASSLGFVDVLLRETDASIAIVDRGPVPGGHWNYAYPFVRLHQPAPLYGLASQPLGEDRIDTHGTNEGMMMLPTGAHVADHFHRAMQEVFLPSGRVQYFPMCELGDDGELRSLLGAPSRRLRARKRLVDGTHLETVIPLTHRRNFAVDPAVTCVPPNLLPLQAPAFSRFVVLGGGKTGLDCVSWLLDAGASPASIRWVLPRDAWWSNRRAFQTAPSLRAGTLAMMVGVNEAMAQARSVAELCEGMEAAGAWLRLDRGIEPRMFHSPTVSELELKRARGIGALIREGHVLALEPGRMRLEGGDLECAPGTLFVDCTASALGRNRNDRTPVFRPGRIDLQMVRFPVLAQSVALIAFIEAHVEDEADKQRMTTPTPMIDTVEDWVERNVISGRNQAASLAHPKVRAWLNTCRLNPIAAMMASIPPEDAECLALRNRIRALAPEVSANMDRLNAALGAGPGAA